MDTHPITVIDEMYRNKQVALANSLIQAREKTSLLESKIEFLGIYKAGDEKNIRVKTDASGREYTVHYVEILSREVRNLMGDKANNGSMYSLMEAVAMELKRKVFIYRDPGNEQFTMKSLYGDVEYNKGKMIIEFNPETEYLFLDLKNNYSRIGLDILFKFTTNGGFQLYKLLKSMIYTLPEADVSAPQEDFPCLRREFTLSELRLQLGYVDLTQADIQKESMRVHPDADRIAGLEKKPKYRRWNDFYARVLEPGIREINQISDIYIRSLEKECVAHGKVNGAVISVQRNRDYYLRDGGSRRSSKTSPEEVTSSITEDQLDEFLDDMRDVIKEPLKTKDLKAVAKSSGYSMEKIRSAYAAACSASHIDNLTGFLISAIQNGYSAPVSRESRGHFALEREYDYEKLEEELLNAQRYRTG